jgi:oligopeptidase B
VAKRVPVERDLHGEVVVDEYAWLRGRDDPEVIAYLEAENAHTDEVLGPLETLREQLFQEIKGHVEETDESAPVPKDGWEYYRRTVEGQEYEIHCRRTRGGGDEQVILDENRLAADEGLEYRR